MIAGAGEGQPAVRRHERHRHRHRRSRWPLPRGWTVALGIVTFVVVLALLALFRYLPAYQALQQGRDDMLSAEQLLRAGGLDVARDQLAQARFLLQEAKGDFGPRSDAFDDAGVAGVLQHVPGLDRNVETVRDLRHAGSAGADLALSLIPILQRVHDTAPGSTNTIHNLVTLGDREHTSIVRALNDLYSLDSAIDEMPSGSLFGPVDHFRSVAQQARQRLDGPVRGGLTIMQTLPRIAGPGLHRYLLLLTNPGEERGGGGFIGAVGALTFQDGQLVGSDFVRSDFSDRLVTDIPAPRPIHDITHTALVLADSDWSPDYPTAAKLSAEFYTRATGLPVDGVINVDPVALSYVLQVIGPVHVPPYPQVVSAGNALLQLNYIINQARSGDPGKVYLAPFGHAVVDAALHTPRSRWAALAAALQRGAAEKHIALEFNDAQLESLVTDAGVGAVLPRRPADDAVLVDDSNLSATKGDLYVRRSFHLSVTVDADGHVHDRLSLTYDNPMVTAPADAALLRDSGGLYEDYVRVYLPPSASYDDLLDSTDGEPAQSVTEEDSGVEDGRPWIAYRVLIEPTETETITVVYDGRYSGAAGGAGYRLDWEKQLNALAWPATVDVKLPDGRSLHWQTMLSADRRWQVS